MRVLAAALVGFVLVTLAAGGGAQMQRSQTSDGVGAIVMVSGRDDHGLLQLTDVPLHPQPDAATINAHIADGGFAEVLDVRGTWLRIRSVADPAAVGWIDDFYLRDRAVLHNAQQVRFLAARMDGSVEVEVQAVEGGGAAHWVEEGHLTEVGGDIQPHDH